MRTSCYILEEKDGIFFCDCWEGMKGNECKHCIALMYFTGKWIGEAKVRSVPLGKKRKPGRPKKNPHCLLRSPDTPVDVTQDDIEIDDPPFTVAAPTDTETEPSDFP